MYINSISLSNYRGIESLDINLDCKSIVMFGVNGSGKTSVVNSVGLILSKIISVISNNRFRQQMPITPNDVRYGASTTKICNLLKLEDEAEIDYRLSYNKNDSTVTIDKKESARLKTLFSDLYLNGDASLPILAHYGVNRGVFSVPLRIKSKHEFGRIEAYQNAISPTVDFRAFFEWFRNQEDLENEKRLENHAYRDRALETTRDAIMAFMPDVSQICIRRNPLRMSATKNGRALRVEQFSDGEKCAIALLGDISRRLALANPAASNPRFGNGIVLIDEVELHMHPSWQRKIVPMLHKTFPNIQFIVTTHSPLVLSDLTNEYKIFGLRQTDNGVSCYEMIPGSYDVNTVLEDNMGVASISPEISELVSLIYDRIKNCDYESAKKQLVVLTQLTNGTHEAITRANIMLRRAMRER